MWRQINISPSVYRPWDGMWLIFPSPESTQQRTVGYRRQKSQSRPTEPLSVIQPVRAYFDTSLDHRSCSLPNWCQFDKINVARHIAKMANKLQVQLKVLMFDKVDSIIILKCFRRLNLCRAQKTLKMLHICGYSNMYWNPDHCHPHTPEHALHVHRDHVKNQMDLLLASGQLHSQILQIWWYTLRGERGRY